MKHKFFINILAVITLIITSCSKDKSPYIPDTSSNNVSATISIGNNAPFQFSATGAAAKIYPLLANPSSYRIEARDVNNNNLIIAVENITQTGTYPFTSNNGIGNGLSFIKDEGSISQVTYRTSDPSITNKGSVTITALNNHHIEGLFTAFCKSDNNTGEVAQISSGSYKGNF
ncbi:MAG: hypothetical protein ABIY51_04395 [Ferruginibacter sp.]